MRGLTRRWVFRREGPEQASGNGQTLPLFDRVLDARGLTDRTAIRQFCDPKLTDLHDPQLLPLIHQGRLDPADIISHRFSLDEGAEAYRLFAEHRDNVLKVILTP